MYALTQAFKKIKISLFNDGLTIYPHITGDLFEYPFSFYPELDNAILDIQTLDTINFVKSEHDNHNFYHLDDFDDVEKHYHLKFSKPIDETTLRKILDIFMRSYVLTCDESESFLHCYNGIARSENNPNYYDNPTVLAQNPFAFFPMITSDNIERVSASQRFNKTF